MKPTIAVSTRAAIALSLALLARDARAAEPPAPPPPDAAAILAKLYEARGGKARWEALKALRVSGIWTAFSVDVPMTIQRMRPNLYRFDHSVLGSPVVLGYDGERVWVRGEPFGAPDGQVLEDDWKRNVIDDAAFSSKLLEHGAHGAAIELRGREKLEGREVWVLGVRPAGLPPETWYVDAQTFLETKRVSKVFDVFSGPGVELEMETYYMDFRPVQGLVLPFREERHFGTRYEVYETRSVEVDPSIDAAVFRAPVPAPAPPTGGP